MDPPLKFLVPTRFGQDPDCGLKLDDGAPIFPPLGVYVPEVLLFVDILPADPVEKEFIKDLETLIADIVTFPADAVDPLWTDLIIEDVAGNVLYPIL